MKTKKTPKYYTRTKSFRKISRAALSVSSLNEQKKEHSKSRKIEWNILQTISTNFFRKLETSNANKQNGNGNREMRKEFRASPF